MNPSNKKHRQIDAYSSKQTAAPGHYSRLAFIRRTQLHFGLNLQHRRHSRAAGVLSSFCSSVWAFVGLYQMEGARLEKYVIRGSDARAHGPRYKSMRMALQWM